MNSYERQRWLEERRKGVGASESAAVCGCSPYATALEVWARKSGQLTEKEATEPMRWGLRLEEVIAEAYVEQTGTSLSLAPEIIQHSKYPFMLASLDRITPTHVVELKTVGAWSQKEWGEPGTDQVPKAYNLQVQQQMACAELGMADIAALFGGNNFEIYTVPRNDRLIQFIAQREAEFWDMVLSGRPPAPDWAHRTTLDTIKALYPITEPVEADLENGELVTKADHYDILGEEIRDKEAERKRVQAELLLAMGPATLAYLTDGSTLTRTPIHAEVKAHVRDYVRFDHKQPKKGE